MSTIYLDARKNSHYEALFNLKINIELCTIHLSDDITEITK